MADNSHLCPVSSAAQDARARRSAFFNACAPCDRHWTALQQGVLVHTTSCTCWPLHARCRMPRRLSCSSGSNTRPVVCLWGSCGMLARFTRHICRSGGLLWNPAQPGCSALCSGPPGPGPGGEQGGVPGPQELQVGRGALPHPRPFTHPDCCTACRSRVKGYSIHWHGLPAWS